MIRIGISGWRYAGWRGNFYPEKWPQRRELEYASRKLSTIELNGSFYSLQKPQYYAQWSAETPAGFLFSVKAPRYITHIRRLRDIDAPLANFFASGLLILAEKLGPILWQFPPSFKFDAELFESFLAQLPHDTVEALALAGKHDEWMSERVGDTLIELRSGRHSLRHAVEIRHESFIDPAFVALLRKYGVALVVADTAGKWPYKEDVTADFMYLRLHGDKKLYESGYSDKALARWAQRVSDWHSGGAPRDAHLIDVAARVAPRQRDVFCYFDNDFKVRAPFDAQALASRLGLQWTPPLSETSTVATPAKSAMKRRGSKANASRPSARTARI